MAQANLNATANCQLPQINLIPVKVDLPTSMKLFRIRVTAHCSLPKNIFQSAKEHQLKMSTVELRGHTLSHW